MPSSTEDLRSRLMKEPGRSRQSAGRSRPGGGGTRRRSDQLASLRPSNASARVGDPEVASRRAEREATPETDPAPSTDTTPGEAGSRGEAGSHGESGSPGEAVSPGGMISPEGTVSLDGTVSLGARPSSTLQKAWIDPEETPFEPVPRPGNPIAARLISWVAVAGFLAALGWMIIPELNYRLTTLDTVELSKGVLSAQAVQLAPTRPAVVQELFVDAGSLPDGVLPKGSPIALLSGTSQDGTRVVTEEVTVPFDARFVSVDTLVGGVVLPGTPVATVYDPSEMYIIVTVRPEMLETLRRGMKAELRSGASTQSIEGEVISAVPLLGTDHEPTTANLVNVRIKPDPEGVADLVPGIRFDALVDLNSAPDGAQPLVFTNAGHVDQPAGTADDATNETSSDDG